MATPASSSAPSSDPVTAPSPSTAAHPAKPFPTATHPPPPSSDPVTAPHPIKPLPHPSPLFASPHLLGRPLSPLPRAAFPVAAPAPARPPAGYVRHVSPAAVAAAAAAAAALSPGQQPVRPPLVFSEHLVRPMVVPVQQGMPAPQFIAPRQARPAGGAAPVSGPPRSSVLPTGPPKVASFSAVSSTPEYNNNCKEREKNREDSVVMIHDRKVRLSDGGSGSLYALCRSWVRNGLPNENQPTIGDGVRLLPRPLPASDDKTNMTIKSEDNNVVEDYGNEHVESAEHLSTQELLKGHIKRAKKVRANLREKRLLRIERYKQRLSLLLPPPSELGRCDGPPRS